MCVCVCVCVCAVPCHEQLEGQDAVDQELKKLLLETELTLLDTRVTLHSLPDRDGQGDSGGPVTLSLVLGALTVGNISAEGEDRTAAATAAEPESAPRGGGGGGQEFQKRVGFDGLRVELARACVRIADPISSLCGLHSTHTWLECHMRSHVVLCLRRGPVTNVILPPLRSCDRTHRTDRTILTSSTKSYPNRTERALEEGCWRRLPSPCSSQGGSASCGQCS